MKAKPGSVKCRWHVYEYLKRRDGNVTIAELMDYYNDYPDKEIAEGVAEYVEAYRSLREWF